MILPSSHRMILNWLSDFKFIVFEDFAYPPHTFSRNKLKSPPSLHHLVWYKNIYSAYPPRWLRKVFIKFRWPDETFTPELSNLSTQIMFYKQRNYWTTSQHFSNVCWSLFLVAYFWQKKSRVMLLSILIILSQ